MPEPGKLTASCNAVGWLRGFRPRDSGVPADVPQRFAHKAESSSQRDYSALEFRFTIWMMPQTINTPPRIEAPTVLSVPRIAILPDSPPIRKLDGNLNTAKKSKPWWKFW